MDKGAYHLFKGLPGFFTTAFVELMVRYGLIAGGAFFLFYWLWRRAFGLRKLQGTFPERGDYLREIRYSLLTAAIFAFVGWIAFSPFLKPWTHWYFRLAKHGEWYFAFSVVAMIVIHDAYFYWTHRLMHWKPLYRVMHQVHHRSTNPSPWAAYSFHPLEAAVEAGIVIVIGLLLPVHPLALALFLLWMTIFNVSGHLGFELYPRWLTESWLGRWLNTSTNHNQHHQYFLGNYGLYFRWWDEWMGTTHAKYESELRRMQAQPYLDPALRDAWREGAVKLWMAMPYVAFGIGLLVLKNAWVALAAFHGSMIAALLLHRNRWSPRALWKGGRLLYLPLIALSVLGFGAWLSSFARQHTGYGAELREMLAGVHLEGAALYGFAIYLCAVNPILEEAFWRGLFLSPHRRLALSDLAYGCFHFLVLLPFMYASYAATGALFLVAMGYLWRQIASRSQGLALPVAWHAMGDLAIVLTIGLLLAK